MRLLWRLLVLLVAVLLSPILLIGLVMVEVLEVWERWVKRLSGQRDMEQP